MFVVFFRRKSFMNVTIVCDVLGSPNNGTTIATLNLIHHLTEKGHNVKIVSADESTAGRKNYYVVPALRLGRIADAVLERNGVTLAKADKAVLEEAIRDADVVHIQIPFALAVAGVKIARAMNKPVTASFHCQAENVTSHLGLMNFPPANRLTYKIFYRNVFRYTDKIHYPTRFIREVFENQVGPTKGEVISNGVNDAFFQTGRSENSENTEKKFTIVCTGRYSKEKAQEVLLKAAAKSAHRENLRIVLAGDGPCKKQLMRLAEKLGIDCEFRFFSREELIGRLKSADLYVHTALIEIEAIACMEAIASGLVPVICDSERSATRFFALDKNNLFRKNDPDDLAAKIDFWYEHRDLKEEYAGKYEELRSEFRQKNCMDRMEKMLLDAIEEYKAS